MNILVTGGAGSVGTNLIEALVKDHNVISWDNYTAGKESNHIEGAKYIRKDTKNAEYDDFDDIDLVYHLGEYSKIHPSFDIPERVFELNMVGSMKMIECCSITDTPIVYAGSSTKLSHPGEMGSPYALFKSTVAKLFQCYGEWYNLKYNICYFYNVYGPKTDTWGNEWQTVINIFKNQKKEGKNLTITGDGTQQRDFTHVEDIVKGLILAGKNIKKAEYQLGTGKQYSILEIAKAFNHPYEFIPPRKGERPSGLADIEQTKHELGYQPEHDIMNYIKNIK